MQEVVDLTGDSGDDVAIAPAAEGSTKQPRGGRGSTDTPAQHLEKTKSKRRHLQKIKTFFQERGIAMGHRTADDSSRFTTGQLATGATVLTKDGQMVSASGGAAEALIVLCNPNTLLFNTTMADRGWGCGYRNCQMLISSLMRKASPTSTGASSRMPSESVPQVRHLQEMLELAWRDGYDGDGADQLDHRAMGTRKWIGTTEIYCILAHLGVRSHIVDFHCPTAADGSHLAMFSWAVEYFTSAPAPSEQPGGGVRFANRHPLYLQHQGHSRTVVGVEMSDDAICLLVFDPDIDVRPSSASGSVRLSRFRLPLVRTRRTRQFQILYVEDACSSPQPIPKQIASQRIP
ncbi:hypothetical protein GGI20_004117 [Coemansia sp. BCRC 34301]|nr:hypothetical protein GGI20_004117 [Coemansia sp. BCRC 34301]